MSRLLFNPVFFYAQILGILALALLLGSLALRGRRGGSEKRLRGRSSQLSLFLEREQSKAVALRWRLRTWLLVRAAFLSLGLIAGLVVGTPVVLVFGLVIGLFGFPFLLEGRGARLRLESERALVDFVRNVVELVRSSSQTLDQALVDAGQNPIPALRTILEPLADTDLSVRDRLIEVDARALSPLANRICADLMLALDTTPEAFLAQANEVLIPRYDTELKIREANRAIQAGSRQSAFIGVGVIVALFLMIMRVDTLRHHYATPTGQIVLIVIGLVVAGSLWLIGVMTPKIRSLTWDLRVLKELQERRYA